MEIANPSGKKRKFRIMIIKMILGLSTRMEAKIEKMQEMFTLHLGELKNKQMNYTLEGISTRITEAEERVNELEDRMVEITATGKKKYTKKNEKK